MILPTYHADRNLASFLGFFDVSGDKTATGLATLILEQLEARSCLSKLVSQTYDGASVMSGNKGGVQTIIRRQCPSALFVHCYAHQLNLVMLYGSKNIKAVRLFICQLTAFHTFFGRSPMRTIMFFGKTDLAFHIQVNTLELSHPCHKYYTQTF